MRLTLTEIKDTDGDTIGWINPRGIKQAGQLSYEYHCTAYRDRETQTRTFSTFSSAKNFILTGRTI